MVLLRIAMMRLYFRRWIEVPVTAAGGPKGLSLYHPHNTRVPSARRADAARGTTEDMIALRHPSGLKKRSQKGA